MALSGVSSGTAITDASGNYAFTGLDNGSYTITPSKTGFTFSPTSSSKTVSGANITGVNFIATAVAPAFSQDELAGTWDAMVFSMGIASGWKHWAVTIDNSGGITFTSYLDSTGSTTLPAGAVIWTISTTGVVSESGASGNPSFHGQMSSNKQLVIGTDSRDTGQTKRLRVYRKRTTGATFTSADLANKTLTSHWLDTGISATDNTWGYASGGTTDGSGVVTTGGTVTDPFGTSPGNSGATLSVSSVGIITLSGEPTFYGLMTDDKKVIFYIAGDIKPYEFGVIMITGQTYTQADYAGTHNFSSIRNNVPNPFWAYGVTSADAAGNGTYLSYTDSGGGATPASFQRVLSSSGVVTDPADATYHGQMSYNNDITVRTNTNASGRYGLTVGFK
jgi:hypothetical protein